MGSGNGIAGSTEAAALCMGKRAQFNGVKSRQEGEAVTRKNLHSLIERQQYKCALSGVDLTPDAVALDHITAISNGGEHEMSNVQLVSPMMNAMKGTLDNEDFIAACRMVVAYHDKDLRQL